MCFETAKVLKMSVKLYSLCLLALLVHQVQCYTEEHYYTEEQNEDNLQFNQTVLEGEEVRFECLPKNTEVQIDWYKDGTLLSEFEDEQQRYQITENNTLIIRNISIDDHGEYECEVDNGNQTAKAFLNVQYKAHVISAPPEIVLQYGKPGLIDCHYKANPPLTNVRWDKDGVVFDPSNMESVFYRKNGSLYITIADERHSGRYTCTPFNDLGTGGPSPPMLVVVQRPPVFVVVPLYAYLRKFGEEITLPCAAKYGDDGREPTIIWSKKESLLPKGRYSVKGGNLTIRNIQKEDEGTYQCSASNRVATVTTPTDLLVENLPMSGPSIAPLNLTANPSVSSVDLKWLPGEKKSETKKYSVWYKPVSTKDWKIRNVPSHTSLEFTISGLDDDTEYDFMVLCISGGESRFSKTIRVKTQEN